MNKDKMKKQRKANYKKWFNRWIIKFDLKKQIEILNHQNYVRVNIPIHKIQDKRDKHMMTDDYFIEMLEEEFTDFKITREKETTDKLFMGRKVGEKEKNTVYIDWS